MEKYEGSFAESLDEDIWQHALKPSFTAAAPNQNISLHSGGVEMLRISPDGFWVRGEKVEQGEGEARIVYDGFVALLNGAGLAKLP